MDRAAGGSESPGRSTSDYCWSEPAYVTTWSQFTLDPNTLYSPLPVIDMSSPSSVSVPCSEYESWLLSSHVFWKWISQ